MSKESALVIETSDKIAPYLAGLDGTVQGAILADLVATWLAGHVVLNGDSDPYREEVLEGFVDLVRKLLPINEAKMQKLIDEAVARDPRTAKN